MRVQGIVVLDPLCDFSLGLVQVLPFMNPKAIFFDRSHHPFGVGVAFGIIVRGKGLYYLQIRAGLEESHAGGLRAVVAHQVQALVSDTAGELPIDRLIQGVKPMGRHGPCQPRIKP